MGDWLRDEIAQVQPIKIPATLPVEDLRPGLPREVRFGDEAIEWRLSRGGGVGPSGEACLWNFARLASESDPESFCHFAKDHGVLYLADTGLPVTSSPDGEARDRLANDWHREPIEAIRAYAIHAKAVLALGKALRSASAPINAAHELEAVEIDSRNPFLDPDFSMPKGAPYVVRAEDGSEMLSAYWGTIYLRLSPSVLVENINRMPSVGDQRRQLAHFVTEVWLRHAGVVPSLHWENGSSHIRLAFGGFARLSAGESERIGVGWLGSPLFGVLAVTLAKTIGGETNITLCTRCGNLFPSKRRARRDRENHYCEICREEVRKKRNAEIARRRRARASEDK